jgi:hypothetical protein
MFQNPLNDRGPLNERNDFHISSALQAFQGINVPDLIQEDRPLLSSESGAGRTAK